MIALVRNVGALADRWYISREVLPQFLDVTRAQMVDNHGRLIGSLR